MVHVWLGTVSVSICQIIVSICQNTDRMSQNSRPAYATAQLAYVPTQPAYATTQLQKDRSVSIKQNTPSMCQNTATVNENMASHIPEHRGWETGTPILPFTPLLLRKIFTPLLLHTRKVTSVQNDVGWVYPNYLPGGGKVGHVTSLEFCCCRDEISPTFFRKFDNRTKQSPPKCFWQMVLGLTNYDLKSSVRFVTLRHQCSMRPWLENGAFTPELRRRKF